MLGSYFKNERGEKQSNSQLRCEQPGRANGACVSVCVYIYVSMEILASRLLSLQNV